MQTKAIQIDLTKAALTTLADKATGSIIIDTLRIMRSLILILISAVAPTLFPPVLYRTRAGGSVPSGKLQQDLCGLNKKFKFDCRIPPLKRRKHR